MKRRDMILGLGMTLLVSMTPRIALSSQNEEKQDEDKHEVEYLFVQSAQGATLANSVLTLKSVAHMTVYF